MENLLKIPYRNAYTIEINHPCYFAFILAGSTYEHKYSLLSCTASLEYISKYLKINNETHLFPVLQMQHYACEIFE